MYGTSSAFAGSLRTKEAWPNTSTPSCLKAVPHLDLQAEATGLFARQRDGLIVTLVLSSAMAPSFAIRRRKKRNRFQRVHAVQLRVGGEEGFGGYSGEGFRLWLGEGLGPYTSKSFNDRRDMDAEVRQQVKILLSQNNGEDGLSPEDRCQMNCLFLKQDFLTRLDSIGNVLGAPTQDDSSVHISTMMGRASCISPSAWNAMLEPEDSPFLEYSFLSGLEESGCVSLASGWQPRFLFVFRPGRAGTQLVGAVPLYLKMHSNGEFCEEFSWVQASFNREISHWPRFFVGVPFTPHRGRRLITAAWLQPAERSEVQQLLIRGLQQLSAKARVSVNAAFATEEESQHFKETKFIERTARQAWWMNRRPTPYEDFDDFLSTLRVKNARTIEKQRCAIKECDGVKIEVFDGSIDPTSVTPSLMSEMWRTCYATTQLRHGNVELVHTSPCDSDFRFDLNEDFFKLLGERLPQRLLLVTARHAPSNQLIGGSLCFVKDGVIAGRYWGKAETELEVPFLHFECCYYAVIEHAIKNRYRSFEPGNGGSDIFKVQRSRGFEPVMTPSYHLIPDPDLREEVKRLAVESAQQEPSWTAPRKSAYKPVSLNKQAPEAIARNPGTRQESHQRLDILEPQVIQTPVFEPMQA